MKLSWKPLLYLHGHVLPDPHWRPDAGPQRGRRTAARNRPVPPMLRWRSLLRAALVG